MATLNKPCGHEMAIGVETMSGFLRHARPWRGTQTIRSIASTPTARAARTYFASSSRALMMSTMS
jgi:hypothetical protein